MRLVKIRHKSLSIDHWETAPEETWCLLGGNASGKGMLADLISGETTPETGQIENAPTDVRVASFERQQAVYEDELRNDDTDYLDRIDTGTTARSILLQSGCEPNAIDPLAHAFNLDSILERGYRLLSSGEARKVLLLKEILSEPDLLILDEPFEGLDSDSRRELLQLVQSLVSSGHSILFLVNRIDDIPDCATHLGLLRAGSLVCSGKMEEIAQRPELVQLASLDASDVPELPPPPDDESESFEILARLNHCSVRYGNIAQFQDFDWELKPGQHTLITGPNGAGKSTLLQLLSGDHPQCYRNNLQIFGYQRGTGESIWDIKKRIGIVSAALHRDYRAPGNALATVVSGFYDSIGLYQHATLAQKNLALQWLDAMGLGNEATTFFRQLSYGQQRLVLIARGLIKQPPLLLLDEPTQGLDDLNRHLVLAFIETLANLSRTTLLFVSHRDDEHLSLFKNRIHFEANPDGNPRFHVIARSDS